MVLHVNAKLPVQPKKNKRAFNGWIVTSAGTGVTLQLYFLMLQLV